MLNNPIGAVFRDVLIKAIMAIYGNVSKHYMPASSVFPAQFMYFSLHPYFWFFLFDNKKSSYIDMFTCMDNCFLYLA